MSGDRVPLEGPVAESVYGALEWSKDQVVDLARRLKNHAVAFLEDPDLFDLIREERRGEEWKLYRRYVPGRKRRILIQLGLTLRSLEQSQEDFENLQALRGKIHRKYGTSGLRAAQLVQRGVLRFFLGRNCSALWPAPLTLFDLSTAPEVL